MPRDYDETAKALIAGAEKAVAAAVAPLLRRIEELEKRQPEKGEKGDPGTTGERGESGTNGKDGIGLAGAVIDREHHLIITFTNGEAKDLGVVVGRDGKDGADGKDGEDGRDGKDGIGEKGEKGDPGNDGRDGKDAYVGEARGLFDPEAQYLGRDVVALNGSAFMAKIDNPGECPGDGWMLLAQRGKRGDKGDRGERGIEGKSGKDGAQPVALKMDAETMEFRMILDNGEECAADFYPIAQAIRGE